MRVKFIFSETKKVFNGNTNHIVKRWFNHDVLGDDSEYHCGIHPYALSDLMGKKFNGEGSFYFSGEPYIIFSSDDMEFVNKVVGISLKKAPSILGMKFINANISEIKVHKGEGSYDILSFMKSPILLREKKINEKSVNYVTVKDADFIKKLTEQTRRKLCNLKFNPLSQEEADSISFEVLHPEGSRVCKVYYKDRFNYASRLHLIVKGSQEARRALYTVGIGNSTATCFGVPEIINY